MSKRNGAIQIVTTLIDNTDGKSRSYTDRLPRWAEHPPRDMGSRLIGAAIRALSLLHPEIGYEPLQQLVNSVAVRFANNQIALCDERNTIVVTIINPRD